MSIMTTSMPLSSPSYLYVHMPSLAGSQNAPVALCMPRRPTWGFPSVPVAAEVGAAAVADGFVVVIVVVVVVVSAGSDSAVTEVALDVPLDVEDAVVDVVASTGRALLSCDVGTRCCTMVLLQANLWSGCLDDGCLAASATTSLRM